MGDLKLARLSLVSSILVGAAPVVSCENFFHNTLGFWLVIFEVFGILDNVSQAK